MEVVCTLNLCAISPAPMLEGLDAPTHNHTHDPSVSQIKSLVPQVELWCNRVHMQ